MIYLIIGSHFHFISDKGANLNGLLYVTLDEEDSIVEFIDDPKVIF